MLLCDVLSFCQFQSGICMEQNLARAACPSTTSTCKQFVVVPTVADCGSAHRDCGGFRYRCRRRLLIVAFFGTRCCPFLATAALMSLLMRRCCGRLLPSHWNRCRVMLMSCLRPKWQKTRGRAPRFQSPCAPQWRWLQHRSPEAKVLQTPSLLRLPAPSCPWARILLSSIACPATPLRSSDGAACLVICRFSLHFVAIKTITIPFDFTTVGGGCLSILRPLSPVHCFGSFASCRNKLRCSFPLSPSPASRCCS